MVKKKQIRACEVIKKLTGAAGFNLLPPTGDYINLFSIKRLDLDNKLLSFLRQQGYDKKILDIDDKLIVFLADAKLNAQSEHTKKHGWGLCQVPNKPFIDMGVHFNINSGAGIVTTYPRVHAVHSMPDIDKSHHMLFSALADYAPDALAEQTKNLLQRHGYFSMSFEELGIKGSVIIP